jgi:exonuclease SbcC
MKPLRLELEAFGAYPTRQTVDFTPLLDGRLFVIHGQTGAGKTTLFDAICYALYGEASTQGRDKNSLRSDHVEQGVMPFVRFQFSVGKDEYEIERTLPYWKPKNKNATPATVVLRHPASKKIWEKDADEQVLMLLGGMKAEQFRQVILLPQGEFQKFLKAKTEERREILKVLFQTQVYSHIEDLLKHYAADLKARYDEQRKVLERLFGAAIPQETANAIQSVEAVEQALLRLRGEQHNMTTQEPMLKAAWGQASERLRAAQEREHLATLLEESERDIQHHTQKEQEIQALTQRLARANDADRLQPHREALHNAQRQQEQRSKQCDEQNARVLKADNDVKAAQRLQTQAEEATPRLQELNEEIIRLNAARPDVERCTELERKTHEARKQCEQAEQQFDEAKKILQSTDDEINDLNKRIPKLTQQASQRQAFQSEEERWKRIDRAQQALEEEREKFKAAKNKTTEALQREQDAAKKRTAQQQTFEQVERAWRLGQAARLALTLEDDAPCPVCGSTSHPHKAHLKADAGIVTDAEYDAAKTKKDAAEETHRAAQELFISLKAELEALKANGEEMGNRYKTEFGEDFATLPDERSRKIQQLQASIEEANKAATRLQAAQERLEKLSQEKPKRAINVEQQDTALQKARNEEASKLSALQTLRQSLTTIGAAASLKELDTKLHALQKEQNTLEAAQKQATEAVHNAENAKSQAQATFDVLREEMRRAAEILEQQRTAFLHLVSDGGFATPEELAAALLTPEERESMRLATEAWHQRGIELASQHKERIQQFGGKERYEDYCTNDRPNLALLESAKQAAEQSWKELVGAKERTNLEVERLAGTLAEIRDALTTLADLEQELIPAQTLAKTANGDNAFKMRFQDYVLAALLDEIISSANLRLRTISSGRYALERKNVSDDKRKAEMLDFDVIDFHTGAKRNARTLSGGETFFTSLALALGLADVVAMRSGGVRMDALFIDEGFGSLDAETLDMALDTLTALQSGGRLVGVISHVSELKERIPVRLEIVKTAHGSRIEAWKGI